MSHRPERSDIAALPPGAARPRRRDAARLLDAALDVFGRYGFEGATTRQIARDAGANLAAIVYHFGSQGGAAPRRRRACRRPASASSIGPALAEAARPGMRRRRRTRRARCSGMADRDTMSSARSAATEAERWARFIVREQMQPTAAFEVIYRSWAAPSASATRLVGDRARPAGRRRDQAPRLHHVRPGRSIFRVAQALVLRRMGWGAIGDEGAGRDQADRRRNHVDAILDAEATP